MAMLPEGWSAHDLGDLAQKIEGGGTPPRNEPSYWDGDIPWASVKDLRGVKLSTTEESISELGLKNSSSKLIPSNTMIIASRMAVGKAVFFNRDVAINQDLKAFYPKKNTDGLFLLQWYLSQSEKIESLATGSTVKGIRLDDLTLLPIDLPPLPEQQKIATILSSVDDVIEKTRAQIDKLKDLKTGMMQELLTKGIGHTEFKDSPVGRIPACWELVRLDKVTKVIDSLHQTPKFSSEGLPMIRIGDIRPGKVNVEKALKVSRDVFEQFTKNHKPKKGDLLMSRVGSYGVCCYLDSNIDLCLGQNTVVILPDKVNSLFLYYSIYSQAIQKQIEFEVAGSGYKSLSLASIRALKVTLPPANEQVKLVSILDSIDKNIDARNESLTAYKSAKKALMQDLLTGKVRVNLTDKESAAV